MGSSSLTISYLYKAFKDDLVIFPEPKISEKFYKTTRPWKSRVSIMLIFKGTGVNFQKPKILKKTY